MTGRTPDQGGTRGTGEHAFVADPSIAWRIVLRAVLPATPAPEALTERAEALAAGQGWEVPPLVVHDQHPDRLALRLAEEAGPPLVVGVAGRELIVSASHAHLDGLGLLTVLEELGWDPVASDARGVDDRPPAGRFWSVAARRAAEVALRPPARVAPPPPRPDQPGDTMVRLRVPAEVRTARLVHAAVRAVVEHNRAAGLPSRHVAVAIGAGRTAPPGAPLADRSALLRLRDVERLEQHQVAQALRDAPWVPPPTASATSRPALETALRVLAPRLGSTLLVSHLGRVTAPQVESLAFYPVTAGGTGLSLGALTHRGATVLTMRARARDWDPPALQELLERVAAELAFGAEAGPEA